MKPPPVPSSLRQLFLPSALALALSVSALVVVPRSNDVGWRGLVHAAPDVGALLLAVALQAVLWAALRAAAWWQARGQQASGTARVR